MTNEMIAPGREERQHKRDLDSRIEAMSWAAFFVWVGAAILFDVGLGVGLLGVGVIVLGTQAIQSAMGIRMEGFWIAVGICLFAGGIWEQFAISVPLVPVLLIALGLVIFLKGGRVRRGTS